MTASNAKSAARKRSINRGLVCLLTRAITSAAMPDVMASICIQNGGGSSVLRHVINAANVASTAMMAQILRLRWLFMSLDDAGLARLLCGADVFGSRGSSLPVDDVEE
mgnify:CR=1 FL=1